MTEQRRLVLHERDDAEEVAAALTVQGYLVDVVRERFQGEDDDEDHAWSVVGDVPLSRLEAWAESLDGWVRLESEDAPSQPGGPRRPLPLPREPRRFKRPPAG